LNNQAPYYWVYILLCNNNSYYTGYTSDLEKRYTAHKNGTAKCKYTQSFKPLRIAQSWKITGDKAFAMRIERYIKKLSRAEKEVLILEPSRLLDLFISSQTFIHEE
jgi:putative endonuclease